MDNEQWRSVAEYEGYYEVSDLGRVRSIPRTVVNRGRLMRRRGLVLKAGPHSKGYMCVNLSKKGKSSTKRVHALVAAAFCQRPAEAEEVNHINSDHLDNRAANLEWVTHQQNITHAIRRGRKSGLTADQVREVRRALKTESQAAICRRLGYSPNVVNKIAKGRTYKHVRDDPGSFTRYRSGRIETLPNHPLQTD